MEFIYFLAFIGLLAFFGIVWNLFDMHRESKHSESLGM